MNDFTVIQPYSPSCKACGDKKVAVDYDAAHEFGKSNLKRAYLCRQCDLNLSSINA